MHHDTNFCFVCTITRPWELSHSSALPYTWHEIHIEAMGERTDEAAGVNLQFTDSLRSRERWAEVRSVFLCSMDATIPWNDGSLGYTKGSLSHHQEHGNTCAFQNVPTAGKMSGTAQGFKNLCPPGTLEGTARTFASRPSTHEA